MDSRTRLGALAELKVASELLGRGYEVFVGWGGKTTCDMVAVDGQRVYRVQVKGTGTKAPSGSWIVQLKSVRANRSQNTIKRFDASNCEIVGIYIEPEDVVVLLNASDLDGKCEHRINLEGTAEWSATRFEPVGG